MEQASANAKLLETYEGLELLPSSAAPVGGDQQLAQGSNSRKRVQASQQARPKSQVKDQISELEQQLSSKMREALLLEQHNRRLKQRSHMLELVIAARDKQVSTLRSLRHQALMSAALPANSNNTASSNGSHCSINLTGQHPVVGRVFSAVPQAPSGPLDPPNWVTLQMYSKLNLEQHMEAYTELVDILSSEMVKPGLGSTKEMMSNLADFTRTVALMTDQLQLLVTRDVRGVQEAVMKALPPSSLNSLPALPGPLSNPQSTQEGEGCSGNPQSNLGTGQPSDPGLASEGSGMMMRASSSAASLAGSMGVEQQQREGGEGGSHHEGRQESGGVSFSDIEGLIQQYGTDAGSSALSTQQQQRGEQAIARYRSSLSGRVGAAIAKASNEVSDAQRPFSAWLARPIHRPSLPEQRARPWNVGLGMADPSSNRKVAVKAAASESNKVDPAALWEVWRSVARALDLSEQQRADAAMLLELHSDWMRSVEAQRTQLSQELSKVLYQKCYHTSNAPNKITEMSIMEALEKNLRSEHAILALVAEVFAFSLLTMEQSAKALIHSWPHITDYVAIMQCAVSEGQQQLLTQK